MRGRSDELIVMRREELQLDIERSFQLAAGVMVEQVAERIERATRDFYVFKEWLTSEEAARYLGISESTLKDEWRKKYNIPCKKVGQQLYFRPVDLNDVINRIGSE